MSIKPRKHPQITMPFADLQLFHDICEGLLEGKPGDWAVLPHQYERVAKTLAPIVNSFTQVTIRFKDPPNGR